MGFFSVSDRLLKLLLSLAASCDDVLSFGSESGLGLPVLFPSGLVVSSILVLSSINDAVLDRSLFALDESAAVFCFALGIGVLAAKVVDGLADLFDWLPEDR